MFTRDELPALALCIAEFATVLDHLNALERVDPAVVPHSVKGRLADELAYLCLQWSNAHGEALFTRSVDVPRIISEARTYCTEHQPEIDELVNLTEGE